MNQEQKLQLIRDFKAGTLTTEQEPLIKKTNLLAEEYFVGEFDEIMKMPKRGTFVFANNMRLDIEPYPDKPGFILGRQLNTENNSVQQLSFKWQDGNLVDIEKGELIKLPEVKVPEYTASIAEQQVRNEINDKFFALATKHAQLFSAVEIPESVLALKTEVPKYGATMFSEFGLRENAEYERSYNEIDKKIDTARDDGSILTADYGNCLEFAQETATKARDNNLSAFVVAACPNHIFNIVVAEGKPYLVDTWHGNLVCEFNAENFYEHASLHGIYNLRLPKKLNEGVLEGIDFNMAEAAIASVNEQAFSNKIHDKISTRIADKITELNPDDTYYLEHASELQNTIDHFCLADSLKTDITQKFEQRNQASDFPPAEYQQQVERALFSIKKTQAQLSL